jgi:hypothetical protein
MPITPYLPPDRRIDPETRRIMSVSFEMAKEAFYKSGQQIEEATIASAVIAVVESGERDTNQICEIVLPRLGHVPLRPETNT